MASNGRAQRGDAFADTERRASYFSHVAPPAARRTLARFCSIFGSVVGDAALMHGARTVAIAGGIVPRFIPYLRASAFRERFLAKGRFAAYLESVSIHVITHDAPGLTGAAVALQNSLRR